MKRISVEEQAALWFVMLQSADRIEDEWLEFEKWIAESQEHDAAFSRLENAWALADRLKEPINLKGSSLESGIMGRGVFWSCLWRRMIGQKWGLLGAAICVGCVLWFIHSDTPPQPRSTDNVEWDRVDTGLGERQTEALADGSVVDLNTETTLRVSIDSRQRLARLDRGEALFSVAHDPARPFWVQAGRTRLEAVGTQFSVLDRNEREVIAIVKEGEVNVYAPNGAFQRVVAQHGARVTPRGIELFELKPGEAERHTAWTQGELKFAGESLDDAVNEFNRYNEQKLRIDDPSIRQRAVAGTYAARDPEGFATMIETSIDVEHLFIASKQGLPTIVLVGKGTREKN
jgi:transmembrane sensor